MFDELKSLRLPNVTPLKAYPSAESTWAEQKAKLKLKFPRLTDADLNFEEARKGEMFSKLQVILKRTAKEIQTIIEKL